MNISDKSSSNKPQIFINHVDLSITEEDIKLACEQKNTKPTSVTIRKNHDQKSNNVNITFASENEAKILKGADSTLVVKDIPLKLEEYQTIYPANIFMKNNHSFTEEELQEGLRVLLKGYFHLTTSHNQVYIYVQDTNEINFLINQEHKIKDKEVRFEKFVQKNIKQNQLYIKFTNPNLNTQQVQDYIKNKFDNQVSITHFSLSDKNPTHNQTTISTTFTVTFNDSKQAGDFYNELKDTQTLLNQPVTFSWKRPENSEDRTILLKFLKEDITEKKISNALQQYGEIQSIEIIASPDIPNKPKTKQAYVILGNESACKNVMADGVKNNQVKELFNLNKPQICPYISKNEIKNFQNAVKTNMNPAQMTQQFQQFGPQFIQGYPQYYSYPAQIYQQQMQQRKPQIPNMALAYPIQTHPQYQQQNINFQHNLQYQHKKTGGQYKNNGNYNQNYNQGYNNNNYNQQQKYQQQHKNQPANKIIYTKQSLQALLESDPKKFEHVILLLIKERVEFRLRSDAKYAKYTTFDCIKKIVEMLTDKEIFEPQESIDLYFDEKEQIERIQEAVDLINSQGGN